MDRTTFCALLVTVLITLMMSYSCGAGGGGTTVIGPGSAQNEDPTSDVKTVELSIRVFDRDSYEDDSVFVDIYNAAISIKWSDDYGDYTESKLSSRDETIFNVPGGNTALELRVSAPGYDPHMETLRYNTPTFNKQVGLKRNINALDPDDLVINVTIPSMNVFPEQVVIDADTIEFNVEDLSITGVGTLQVDGSVQLGDFILQDPTVTTTGTITVEDFGGIRVTGQDINISATQGVNLETGAVIVDDIDIEFSGQTELEIDDVNCATGCIDADDLFIDSNGVVVVCDSAIQLCP